MQRLLNAKEHVALVEPWQRIFTAIEGGKEQLVAMSGGERDHVASADLVRLVGWRLSVGADGGHELLRVEAVDSHRKLGLIALDGGMACMDGSEGGHQLLHLSGQLSNRLFDGGRGLVLEPDMVTKQGGKGWDVATATTMEGDSEYQDDMD
jgi:hypothetical protein